MTRLRPILALLALSFSWTSPPGGGVSARHTSPKDRATEALLGALLALARGRADEETMGGLFATADQLVQEGDARAAMRVMQLAARLDPSLPEARLLQAQIACQVGHVDRASEHFTQALSRTHTLGAREERSRAEQRTRGGTRENGREDGGMGGREEARARELRAVTLARFGMCLMEARRFGPAAMRLNASLAIDPIQEGIAWHLALAHEYGGAWPSSEAAYLAWLRLLPLPPAPPPARRAPAGQCRDATCGGDWAEWLDARRGGRKVVAILCLNKVAGVPLWGPDSLGQAGIGGSEEAVIFLSRELARFEDLDVRVFGYPPEDVMGRDSHSVTWLPVQLFPSLPPPDVFVSWRGYALGTIGGAGARNFLWLHDRVIPRLAHPDMVARLTGVFLLSQHHASQLPPHAVSKAIVSANGVDSAFWINGSNAAREFVFASHPERGLEQVLLAWPAIAFGVPGATLNVYHGFPKGYGEGGAPPRELEKMRALKARVEKLLAQANVTFLGFADQPALANAYSSAGFWLYPISMAETSCISAMKAMGNGAIPITSRFPQSGLVETVGEFDLGPAPPPGATIDSSPAFLREWSDAVVRASRAAEAGSLAEHRANMVKWARKRYSWSTIARQWREAFAKPLPQL